MNTIADPEKKIDKRCEVRVESYGRGSVEFIPGRADIPYQFKLKDFSSKGFGILVRKDSKVLERLKAGDTLNMRYYPGEGVAEPVDHKTQIRHISEPDPGTHKDHMLIGLSIIE